MILWWSYDSGDKFLSGQERWSNWIWRPSNIRSVSNAPKSNPVFNASFSKISDIFFRAVLNPLWFARVEPKIYQSNCTSTAWPKSKHRVSKKDLKTQEMRDNRLMKWSINKDRPGREYKKKISQKIKIWRNEFQI